VKIDTSLCGTFGITFTSNGATTDPGCLDCTLVGGVNSGSAVGVAVGNGAARITIVGVSGNFCTNNGFQIDAQGAAAPAQIALVGCMANGNGSRGYHVLGGAAGTITDVSFDGCKATSNVGAGLVVDAAAGAIVGTQIVDFTANLGTFGVNITAGAKGTQIQNLNCQGNLGGSDLQASDNVIADGVVCRGGSGSAGQAYIELLGGRGVLRNIDVTIDATATSAGIGVYTHSARSTISGRIDYAGNPGGFLIGLNGDAGTNMEVDNFILTSTGGVAGIFPINAAGVATRICDNVNISVAASGGVLGAAFNRSMGTPIALGIGNTTVPFADVRPEEVLTITTRAAAVITVTPSAGVGFVVNSSAAVNADYSIR
jgi:hypothetical protein